MNKIYLFCILMTPLTLVLPAQPSNRDNATSDNLVLNGDYESGVKRPTGWDMPDNLTIFWEKNPSLTDLSQGKCIRIDTDVYMKDWERRKKELKENPNAPPWSKTPTSGKKYDTIGGNDGVSFYSAPIPVKKGKSYNLYVDVRSDQPHATPKVFIKGYTLHKGEMRVIYKTYLNCRLNGAAWQHFEQTFSPTEKTPNVTEMRVMIFAYWTPGEYFFDNVKIFESNP
jgi:hypothetical protein